MQKWNSLNSEKSALVCEDGVLDWYDVTMLLRRTERLLIINNPLCPETLYWMYRAFSEGVGVSVWKRNGDDLSRVMSPFGFQIIDADNWIDCWKKFQEL